MKINKLIFLVTVLLAECVFAQENQISGTITDTKGAPIGGANIVLLGTGKGVSTNMEGNYQINDLSRTNYFIEISYLGYQTITRSIVLESGGINTLDFILQETSGQLDEVIVTSNRRLENIQKTATSVSAVSAKGVEQLQINNFNELSSIAPNFQSYDDGATGAYTLFSSRGISTIDVVPIVGVYVDDVPYFSTFAFPMALNDVAQIEVLRGPQGTLYGRNALAGVIKINTKKPVNTLSGFAKIGYGNLNAKEMALGLNAPLVNDKLFFRSSFTIADRDGFVENLFNGKDLQNRESVDANFKLKYYASDKLSLGLLYNVQRRESDAYAFALAGGDITLQSILDDSPYQINYNTDVFQQSLKQNIALDLKYNFNSFVLNSVTSYQLTDQNALDEADYSAFDIQSFRRRSDYNNIAQEFRLASISESKFQWTAGAFLYRNDEDRRDNPIYGNDVGFLPGFEGASPFQQIDLIDMEIMGYALFGQASYEITDKLTITGGMRYDDESVEAGVDRSFTNGSPSASFTETANFNAISPKVAVSYQADENIFLFANVAKGFRAGGINTFVADPADAPYDPETLWNYEVGIKTNLADNRIKLNLTGFYIDYTDQQVFDLLDLTNFVIGTDNIGESRSYGLELETQWAVTKGFSINANAGYLNTEILDYTATDFSTLETIDFSGNVLPVSPEFNGNINLNYILPVNSKFNIESSLDYNYQSKIFFAVNNDTFQEAYGLLNAKIGITSKHMDFFVWGKNLTDEAYFSYGYGVGSFNAAAFGLPQTYGATLTAKF